MSSFAVVAFSSTMTNGTGSNSGDILFVAAGVEHHYEDFSDDLALWRIFYGRRGGEIPA